MALPNMAIKAGDSTDIFVVTLKETINGVITEVLDYTGYYAMRGLYRSADKSLVGELLRIEPINNSGFRIFLQPSDTQDLIPGDYLLGIEITKEVGGVPVYRKEFVSMLTITRSLINV